jgi:hypothetical protein
MIWLVIAIIGSGTFIFSGVSVLMDPFCKSVDFGGGRVVQITCRDDSFGAFSQVSAGWLSILGGLSILIFIFRNPLINILKVPNYTKDQRGDHSSFERVNDESSDNSNFESQELNTTLDSQLISQGSKKCKYCAELINFEAIKCKYCGSSLTPNSSEKMKTYLKSSQGKIVSIVSVCVLLLMSVLYINQTNKAKEMRLLNANGQICVTGNSDESIDFGCTNYPNGEIYFCSNAKVLKPYWTIRDYENVPIQGTNYLGRIEGIPGGEFGRNCTDQSLPNLFAFKWQTDFRVGIYEMLSLEYGTLEGDSYIEGGSAGEFIVEISIKE